MRWLLAGVLLIHGIAHIVGFVVPWKIIVSSEVPYRTTVLGVDIGKAGIRAVGLAWLVLAWLFIACAANLTQHEAVAPGRVVALVTGSFLLCALGLPESRPGLFANAGILALLAVDWFATSHIFTSMR